MPELAARRTVAAHRPSRTVPPSPNAPNRATIATVVVIVGVVLGAQIPIAVGLLHPDVIYEAGHAKTVLAINALLATLTVASAAFLPHRLRALAILPGAVVAAAMLGGAVTVGGHLWDFAMAALTAAAAWWSGRRVLRALGARLLQDMLIVEVAIGVSAVALAVLLLGRFDILAWWSAGVLTVAGGAVGLLTGARAVWARRRPTWTAIAGSRVAVACAGLLLLQLGWAIVWLSAPEIMYDALYAKAYLPELWAHSGSVGPLLAHPVLNVTGAMQIVAVPGHAVGARDVGRELQLLAWALLVGTIWWVGRRSAAGPIAALLVGLVPQMVWQTATADDDLMLAAGAMALAIAVLRTTGRRSQTELPTFGTAIAIGLLAGACLWLKLSLLAITIVLAVGWILAAPPRRNFLRRAFGVGVGALVAAGPALALRWIDTGNPVFPAYNTLFKSSHYPLVDEQYNFPFWAQGGLSGALKTPYEAVVHPYLMNDTAPPGAYGVLVAAIAVAALIGWRSAGRRATLVVWLAMVVSVVTWWMQFRYLRYVIPSAMLAVVLVLAQMRSWRPGRAGTTALLLTAGLASAFYLPSTVASFWNVPYRNLPFAAAFGRWSTEDYLRTVFPEKDALEAYQRLAEPGADAVSDAHERLFLRDRDLSPTWEVERLLAISGPTTPAARATFHRLRRLRLDWALVTGPNRTPAGTPWLAPVLARYGEDVFSDRGWDLYHLVEHPARPRMLAACDPILAGQSGCWTGTFDARPGLTDGESATGANRDVRVCPGETLAVQLTTALGGQSAQVSLNSDSGSAKAGHNVGAVGPGGSAWVYGTAPPGTHLVNVAIAPGIDGGAITRVRIGVLGRCSSVTR